MGNASLVIGASGFLGSHVTRQLVRRGERVRVLIRNTSSTTGIDDLDLERHYGDIFDRDALGRAITGCDTVFYCVVDTRAWLRHPAPLFRTNVDGLRHVLEVAAGYDLRRFVYTSTIGTIARSTNGRPVTEQEPFNWMDKCGAYVRSRVVAENLVLRYHAERRLPAVAMCVANTYGARDWQPTPQGSLVAAAAAGKMPYWIKGLATEVVGIDDAAEALILAADHGRNGERYIVSERYMPAWEVLTVAAEAVGAQPPRWAIPLPVMYALGYAGDLAARLLRRDLLLSSVNVRLLDLMSPMDHSKATRELGWQPRPTDVSIREAARFFRGNAVMP